MNTLLSLNDLRLLIASNDEALPSFGPMEVRAPGCEPSILTTDEWMMFHQFRVPTGIGAIVDEFDRRNEVAHDSCVFVTWCPFGRFVRFSFALD